MRKWTRSTDLMAELQGLYTGLREGDVPVEQARAASNILKQAVKVVELELEHARITGRIKDGCKKLPGFERGEIDD